MMVAAIHKIILRPQPVILKVSYSTVVLVVELNGRAYSFIVFLLFEELLQER